MACPPPPLPLGGPKHGPGSNGRARAGHHLSSCASSGSSSADGCWVQSNSSSLSSWARDDPPSSFCSCSGPESGEGEAKREDAGSAGGDAHSLRGSPEDLRGCGSGLTSGGEVGQRGGAGPLQTEALWSRGLGDASGCGLCRAVRRVARLAGALQPTGMPGTRCVRCVCRFLPLGPEAP